MDAKNNPSTPGLAHQAQAADVEVVRTVYGGTRAMRGAGKKFLPMFPRESVDGYADRLNQAVLFNALKRTVGGLTGMVFRRDPKLGEDVPEVIRGQDDNGKGGHWENIDAAGRHGAVFAKDVFDAMLLDGHTYVFVDFPPVDPARVRSAADEERAGLRPYWTHYLKQDLLSFRIAMRGGVPGLTQVCLREVVTEYDGDFGERQVEQVRVYRLPVNEDGSPTGNVEFTIWRKNGEEWEPSEPQSMAIGFIPLIPYYANRTGNQTSDPPLLDLALENIAHYQVRSDRRTHLHIASVPIPVFIGLEDAQDLVVGSDMGIRLPKDGDAKYLEPTGAALESSRTELQDILQNMAALGLAMLQRETRAAETAEAKRIDKSETDSRLSSAARGLQDGIEASLGVHAAWLKLPDGGSCEVNREFESQTMDPTMVKALSEAVGAGQLSLETLWDTLQKGGVLPEGFDSEIEFTRISEAGLQPPAPKLEVA